MAKRRKRKQLDLPGVPKRASKADMIALVRSRLEGLEIRQQERARLRAERKLRPNNNIDPLQGQLF